MKKSGAQRLGEILSALPLKGPGPLQAEEILQQVGRCLGESVMGDLRLGSYARGRLVLEVRSAALAFELGAFHSKRLLNWLRATPGLEHLEDIRFRVAAWR